MFGPSCFSRALEIVTLSLSNSYPGKQKKHFKICTLIQFSSIDYFSSILFPLIEAKNLHRPHKLMNAVNFHQIISLRYFLNFKKIQANSKILLRQGRKWLPITGWASSNVQRGGVPPPAGGAFYSAKNWVSNCPPCQPASYAPELRPGRFSTQPAM